MIELTPEQHEAFVEHGTEPVRAIDRTTNVEYVMIRADVYEELQALVSDGMPDTAALINEVMQEDDAKDPYLESYQHYAREHQ